MTDYRDRYYELRDATGRLIDAMGHDPDCAFVKDMGGVGCDCGGWPSMIVLRGELMKLLRERGE